jgi:diacylglycerol kinase family enzyme
VRTEVVVNPNAAGFLRDPSLEARVRGLAGDRARVWVTPGLAELDRAAQALIAARAERVVLCGGDGSFMAGLSALWSASNGQPLPEVVLGPAGTVATVARNLGQRAALLPTLERALAGPPLAPTTTPTLQVREDDGPTRIGFIFGTGLVARFFERYYATGAGGYLAAARIVARVFVSSFRSGAYARSVLDPLPCVLTVDGRELAPRAWSLVVSSVVRDLGLHMRVNHRAAEDPERPHLVASPLPPRALGPQAPRVLLGRKLSGRENFDGLVGRFDVRFPGRGPYVLDGDLLHATRVEVCAGPVVKIAVA